LDSGRATAVAHAVASAIAAAHATDMAHGNVHPGTVLIADDGRVVLADARAGDSATMEQDVRSVGGILYSALTGHWPHAELGPDRLPDGIRDAAGSLASPRQVRGGLPGYLSELSMDLLDPSIAPASAEALAGELGRLDTDDGDEFFGDGGPFGFITPLRPSEPDVPRRSGRKLTIGVAALLLISAAAIVVSLRLTGGSSPAAALSPTESPGPSASPTTSATTGGGPIQISGSAVRIVDPPNGTRDNLTDADKAVDGDANTGWQTNWYKSPAFGNLKPGMGVLIDLGKPVDVANVKVDFDSPGATVSARVGDTDPGSTTSGDDQINKTYKTVTGPIKAGPSQVLPLGVTTRYVLIWITKLPSVGDGKYQVAVDEITVNGS
jgi:hypothetical protein